MDAAEQLIFEQGRQESFLNGHGAVRAPHEGAFEAAAVEGQAQDGA